MTDRALQDQIPHNHCFGCGPENEAGLHLKSYWSGTGPSVARFEPQARHCAGPEHFVNGGIIATLIDCHSVCTATAAAYYREDRPIGSDPLLCFATSRLDVAYRRPTPMGETLELTALVTGTTEKGFSVECEISAAGRVCAAATVEAARVPLSWMGLE